MARTLLTLSRIALLLLLVGGAALTIPWHPASAFTEEQVEQVFAMLDASKTGKVDKAEYDQNKVAAMFWTPKTGTAGLGELTYEETQFNRAFFNAADTDHKGKLDGVDMIYALEFEKIDLDRKGYITIDDLRRFMQKAGR
jgi:Ca2+-binding EF-hand superfamily protein